MFAKFDSNGAQKYSSSDSTTHSPNHATENPSSQTSHLNGKHSPVETPIPSGSIKNGIPLVESNLTSTDGAIAPSPNQKNGQRMALSSVIDATTNEDEKIQTGSAGRSAHKSKSGCLTCKFRKKKCDETKPVCRDCLRFNKECVWVDHRTMNGAEIERLRARVREKESSRKLRKRVRLPRLNISDSLTAPSSPSMSPELPLDPDGMVVDQASQTQHVMTVPHPLSEQQISSVSSNLHNFASAIPGSANFHRRPWTTQNGSAPQKKTGLSTSHSFENTRNSQTSAGYFAQSTHQDSLPPCSAETSQVNNFNQSSSMQDILSPFEHIVEPRSPAAVMGFLKELSVFNWSPQNSSHGQIEEIHETHTNSGALSSTEDGGVSPRHVLPNFNIPNFIEQMQAMSHDYPSQLNNLASSFNATFSPSPRASLSFSPELDSSGSHLYNYYSEFLSQKVSIAPNSQNDSNSYQRVFLPLAQKDKGVLYGLLAWAGFHLGGQWMAEGSKYAELALKHLCADVSFTEGSQTMEDRRVIVNKLAALLIMCGAEICRGDVKYWSIYLQWGWKLLKSNGGIMNFNNNKEEHWLISNFAYHDLLASSTSDRGTYFPNETYDRIFVDSEGISSGNLNPLLGISKPLYKVIGDISSLFFESKQIMNEYYRLSRKPPKMNEPTMTSPEETGSLHSFPDTYTEQSDHTRVADLLNFISNKAHDLEISLSNAKPNASDLESLSDSELELQLTTFEAFQLTSKLYLRQAILRLNPSSLECQILMNDLIKCLDILIDTPMQATLVFPTFIAGLFTVTDSGKSAMRGRFEKLIADYGPWNVVRVRSLCEKIWDENPQGDRVVDWNAMLNDLNWDLNFA